MGGRKVERAGASRRARGMTLVELMIAGVVIGMLVAVAYPSYQSQIEQSRRTDGKTMLLTAAQHLERCFAQFHSYVAGSCAVAADIADGGMPSADGWYLITNDNVSATKYRLVATPQNAQASDTQCGALRLTHTGVRDATGSVPDRCW